MKYTSIYLKYLVVVLLLIITVFTMILGVLCVGLGIFGPAQGLNPGFLILIPVGLFCGFLGFAAFDCFKYLMDKWVLNEV